MRGQHDGGCTQLRSAMHRTQCSKNFRHMHSLFLMVCKALRHNKSLWLSWDSMDGEMSKDLSNSRTTPLNIDYVQDAFLCLFSCPPHPIQAELRTNFSIFYSP